eukprot:54748-Eustigmatos_ZCMA.PRE.1
MKLQDLSELAGGLNLSKKVLKEIVKQSRLAIEAERATERAGGGRTIHSTALATGSREPSPERMDVDETSTALATGSREASPERRSQSEAAPERRSEATPAPPKKIEALPTYARTREDCEQDALIKMRGNHQSIPEITKQVKDAFDILPGKLNMQTSTQLEIEKAFRRPFYMLHPDRFRKESPEVKKAKAEEFQRLNAAKVLCRDYISWYYKCHKAAYPDEARRAIGRGE